MGQAGQAAGRRGAGVGPPAGVVSLARVLRQQRRQCGRAQAQAGAAEEMPARHPLDLFANRVHWRHSGKPITPW